MPLYFLCFSSESGIHLFKIKCLDWIKLYNYGHIMFNQKVVEILFVVTIKITTYLNIIEKFVYVFFYMQDS